jgi:radical SAM protein with 4Fe4S-binding SPASM domain
MNRRSILEPLADQYLAHGRLFRLHLDLTWQCPLACTHCYLGGQRGPGREMTTRDWLSVLDEAAEFGVFYLLFSGGEPLCRPDFWEILASARERRFVVSVKTTGFTFGPGDAERLAGLHPFVVDVSLHGSNPDTHDAFVGMPGAYGRVRDAIVALRRAGVQVRVLMSACEANAGEAADLVSWCDGIGARCEVTTGLLARSDGGPMPVSSPSMAVQAEILADRWGREKREGRAPDPGGILCRAGHVSLHVDPGGDVTPCAAWPLVLGNVRTDGLRGVLASGALASVRRLRHRERSACRDCDRLPWCGFCPGQGYAIAGNPLAPSPYSCEQAEVRRLACAIVAGEDVR